MNLFVARSVMRGLINGRSYYGSSINSGHRYSTAIVSRGAQLSGQQIGVLFGWRRMMRAPAMLENPEIEKKNRKESMVSIFESWCDRYGKKYSSEEEKNYRLKIFEENYTYVKRNNMVNPYHSMAVNEFSDLSDDDLRTNPPGVPKFLLTDEEMKELEDEMKKLEEDGRLEDGKLEDEAFRRNQDPLLRAALDARKDLDLSDEEFEAKFGSLFSGAFANLTDEELKAKFGSLFERH